jgi:multidrug efflux system membrane fusion protein
VVTGPTEGALVAIDSGLAPGERVVTDGLDRLREGAKVEVTQPAGSKGAPAGGSAPKGAGAPGGREEFKKRLESASPEEREKMREESKKRREAAGK